MERIFVMSGGPAEPAFAITWYAAAEIEIDVSQAAEPGHTILSGLACL